MSSNIDTFRECLSCGSLRDSVGVAGLSTLNGLYFPGIVTGGSSTTYTRDAIYMVSNIITIYEWMSYGYLWTGIAYGGLSGLYGRNWFGDLLWYFATK